MTLRSRLISCRKRNGFAANRKGVVSLIFASAFIVMLMLIGLSINYSFYNDAQTELNMAADAASIHAVRLAVQAVLQQQSNYATQGQQAGTAWFNAQAGNVPQAQVVNAPVVTVSFNTSTNLMTATVAYTGTMSSFFGKLLPNWAIAGTATSVESTQTYIEFDFLLDNSSSMLIASTDAGIAALNAATPCSTAAATAGQGFDGTYTWYFNSAQLNNNSPTPAPSAKVSNTYIPYGYGVFSYTTTKNATAYVNESVPPKSPVTGICNPNFTGTATGCAYMPSMPGINIVQTNGYAQCANGSGTITGGAAGSYVNSKGAVVTGSNVPQAPCAFACHWASGSSASNPTDYYGVARANNIPLRFDVVQSSSTSVVQSLITYLPNSPVPAPFHIGVYTFNNSLGTLYSSPTWPANASAETAELNAAVTAINNYTTPVVADSADTDFPDSMTTLATTLTSAGNGSTSGLARKNLFIVTDGMQDYVTSGGSRTQGPITTDQCTAMKNKGYTIYVLYTEYNPLPNYFYLNSDQAYAEPTTSSPIAAALQSCASSSATYFVATDSASINTAMQTMLHLALTSPGRLSY